MVVVTTRQATRPRWRWALGILAAIGLLVPALGLAPSAVASNSGTWSAPVNIDGSDFLSSVSCTSSSFCVAVDASGNALIWDGIAWSAPVNIDGSNDLASVSCSSSSFCVAVDHSDNALTWDGTSWSAPLAIDAGLYSVSCSSSSFCVAVNAGSEVTWDGTSWSAPLEIDSGGGGIYSVSCSSSSSFCVALDELGNALTWDGTSWSALAIDNANNYPSSVSCSSSSFCVAVDESGNALTWDGTSWSTLAIDPPYNHLYRVSCSSSSFCVAVDLSGNDLTWDGTSWSAPVDIDAAGNGLNSVSCSSSSFCVAVDNSGNAVTYTSTTSSLAITTTSLPNGYLGQPYSVPLAATGGTSPYTWSIINGSLPPGLSLDPVPYTSTAGIISGTPTSVGTSSFTVEATDAASQTAQATLSIVISHSLHTFTSPDVKVVRYIAVFPLPLLPIIHGPCITALDAAGFLYPVSEAACVALHSSSNPQPPGQFSARTWSAFVNSDQYRGYDHFTPVTVGCLGNQIVSINGAPPIAGANQFAMPGYQSSPGFTPEGPFIFDPADPFMALPNGALPDLGFFFNSLEPYIGVIDGGQAILVSHAVASRLGDTARLANFTLTGHDAPFIWSITQERITCHGYQVATLMTDFPATTLYVNNKLVTQLPEDVSQLGNFILAGGSTLNQDGIGNLYLMNGAKRCSTCSIVHTGPGYSGRRVTLDGSPLSPRNLVSATDLLEAILVDYVGNPNGYGL